MKKKRLLFALPPGENPILIGRVTPGEEVPSKASIPWYNGSFFSIEVEGDYYVGDGDILETPYGWEMVYIAKTDKWHLR